MSCEYTGSGTREMELESLDGETVTLLDTADEGEASQEGLEQQTEAASKSGSRTTMSLKDFLARLDSYLLPTRMDD